MPLLLQDGTPLLLQDGSELWLQNDPLVTGPTINQQPADATTEAGGLVTYTVVATSSGGPLSYQWYGEVEGLLAGKIADSLTRVQVPITEDGQRYYVEVTDDNGTTESYHALQSVVQVVLPTPPGSLYRAAYPDFFPCPNWSYNQGITNHLRRTPFESGWTRQRKHFFEANTSVQMQFSMATGMFDNWSRWMAANGHDWFTLYMDRYNGERALYEVRLTGDIEWQYVAFNRVVASVTGELGSGSGDAPDYGPEVPPEVPPPTDACVPVYFTHSMAGNIAGPGQVVTFTAPAVNGDATAPLAYRWLKDGVVLTGEVGPTLDVAVVEGSVNAKYMVEVNNPCGFDQSNAADLTIAEGYSCSAFVDYLTSQFPGAKGIWDFSESRRYKEVGSSWYFTNLANVGGNDDVGTGFGTSKYFETGVVYDACEKVLAINEANNPDGIKLWFNTEGNPRTSPANTLVYAHKIGRSGSWPQPIWSVYNTMRVNRTGVGTQYKQVNGRVYAVTGASNSTQLRLHFGFDQDGNVVEFYSDQAHNLAQSHLVVLTINAEEPVVSGLDLVVPISGKLWIDGAVAVAGGGMVDIGRASSYTFEAWDFTQDDVSADPTILSGLDINIGAAAWIEAITTDADVEQMYQAYLRNFDV